ncbi:MAG TPA: IclR family transcriptional regulator [Solirubrobacteraceae bacterium]|nr:IclR family transcriptional regulator [Solirubrobacteraceae bacterium]
MPSRTPFSSREQQAEFASGPPGRTLRSLNHALDVLEALAARPDGEAGVRELALALGTSASAMHSVLRNLLNRGYIQQDAVTRRYQLGLAAWRLGSRVSFVDRIRSAAKPVLESLSALTRETSLLSLYDHGEVLYVECVQSPEPVASYVRVGERAPAYCTASGKVQLAHQPAVELDRLYQAGFEHFTSTTLEDLASLRAELGDVHRTGYAVNRAERQPEIVGIASPVRDATGAVVAGLGVSGPAYRIPAERAEEMAGAVAQGAGALSRALGWPGAGSSQTARDGERGPASHGAAGTGRA